LGHHLIDGEFQSNKYPTTPRGKVPLSVRDEMAQDLLWEYARRRRRVDAEFSDYLEAALRLSGSSPPIAGLLSLAEIAQAIPEISFDPEAGPDDPSSSSQYVDGYMDARSLAIAACTDRQVDDVPGKIGQHEKKSIETD